MATRFDTLALFSAGPLSSCASCATPLFQLCQLCHIRQLAQLVQRNHFHQFDASVRVRRWRYEPQPDCEIVWDNGGRHSEMSYLAGRLRQSFTAAPEQIHMSVLTDRFTKAEAPEYLGVSERSLDLWRGQGTGPRAFYIAGKACWLKSDCDEWLAAQLAETSRGRIR